MHLKILFSTSKEMIYSHMNQSTANLCSKSLKAEKILGLQNTRAEIFSLKLEREAFSLWNVMKCFRCNCKQLNLKLICAIVLDITCQGVIVSGHVLISCAHISYSVNKIASALRCVRSADQNMAANNRPLIFVNFFILKV